MALNGLTLLPEQLRSMARTPLLLASITRQQWIPATQMKLYPHSDGFTIGMLLETPVVYARQDGMYPLIMTLWNSKSSWVLTQMRFKDRAGEALPKATN